MVDERDTDSKPQRDPNDLARQLMVAASHFASAAIERYRAEYPEQCDQLASSGAAFAVRIDNMLSERPRVSLVMVARRLEIEGQLVGREVEVVHVELSRLGASNAVRH